MRFNRTIVSSLVLAILITMTGCGSSSNGTSTTTPPPSTTNQWTWESGSNTASTQTSAQPGVYGTLGVAAAGNVPGGRAGAVSWTDSSGNLWLFGGDGNDSTGTSGLLNDLWEFNLSSKEWTWVSGSNLNGHAGVYGAAAGNVPGSRSNAVSWIDSSGNLWLFGGIGYGSNYGIPGYLNDLWEFSPASKQWTWVSGSNSTLPDPYTNFYGTLGIAAASNMPGGRAGAVSWVDRSGNLWLFGGWGYDASGLKGDLNDLWEFNPATDEWIWQSGSQFVGTTGGQGQPGVYGTLGVAAAGNVPGGRDEAVGWVDSSGKLWLFGGEEYYYGGNYEDPNDLWEFDTVSKEWTWQGGINPVGSYLPNSTVGVSGVYGTLGVAAAGNMPGSRVGAVSWIDSSGKLWLFGGVEYGPAGYVGLINDLWKFDPAAKEWTWVNGTDSVSSQGGALGVNGTLGVAAAGNVPSGRASSVSWTDNSGNLWLFGGVGAGPTLGVYLNDLWKYQP
jgi:N-acetylneuraminic acid mutarotase